MIEVSPKSIFVLETMEVEKSSLSKPKKVRGLFQAFCDSFEEKKAVEEKIEVAIEFMKRVLEQSDGVTLKDFWDTKNMCSPLFKEKIPSIKRRHFWAQYMGLVDEARRLKEIQDEQIAFSVEQIELAIEALEKEVEHSDFLIDEPPPLKGEKKYALSQREFHLLKTLITRLDVLRKEILGTDMRIGHKNRILKRLSKLGDLLFPKRKALVKKVSEAFILDVEAFIKDPSAPSYVILNEIKRFQELAKHLPLNSQSFNKGRKMLSECWEKTKEQERGEKKERGERSEEERKNFEQLSEKVEAFTAFCEGAEDLHREKITGRARPLEDEVGASLLSRDQAIKLRSQIERASSKALAKIRDRAAKARAVEMKEVEDFKGELSRAIEGEGGGSLESLQATETQLREVFKGLSLSPLDALVCEWNFLELRSLILDEQGKKTVSKEALETLFDEREVLFNTIKKQMEIYRKEMGGSSLDFEKAMIYRELYESARVYLDREIGALQQIEDKLNAD